MATTVKTNNVPRNTLSGYELTRKERCELDYIAEADDENAWSNEVSRFFRYRGNIYDLHEFSCIVPREQCSGFMHPVDSDSALLGWDGIQTDSFFSGVVVRYVDHDCESIVVGLALS